MSVVIQSLGVSAAMVSTRAQSVAEVLWELKKADRVATLTAVARRAGFSPGSNGRTVLTALKAVKRDWSHLQWWRAVPDSGLVEKGSLHAEKLEEVGFELQDAESDDDTEMVSIVDYEEYTMVWEDEGTEGEAKGGEEEE